MIDPEYKRYLKGTMNHFREEMHGWLLEQMRREKQATEALQEQAVGEVDILASLPAQIVDAGVALKSSSTKGAWRPLVPTG